MEPTSGQYVRDLVFEVRQETGTKKSDTNLLRFLMECVQDLAAFDVSAFRRTEVFETTTGEPYFALLQPPERILRVRYNGERLGYRSEEQLDNEAPKWRSEIGQPLSWTGSGRVRIVPQPETSGDELFASGLTSLELRDIYSVTGADFWIMRAHLHKVSVVLMERQIVAGEIISGAQASGIVDHVHVTLGTEETPVNADVILRAHTGSFIEGEELSIDGSRIGDVDTGSWPQSLAETGIVAFQPGDGIVPGIDTFENAVHVEYAYAPTELGPQTLVPIRFTRALKLFGLARTLGPGAGDPYMQAYQSERGKLTAKVQEPSYEFRHYEAVQRAIADGKPLPPMLLADYEKIVQRALTEGDPTGREFALSSQFLTAALQQAVSEGKPVPAEIRNALDRYVHNLSPHVESLKQAFDWNFLSNYMRNAVASGFPVHPVILQAFEASAKTRETQPELRTLVGEIA